VTARRPTPGPAITGLTAYRVPRHPAPCDLVLDGNEGRPPAPALLDVLDDGAGELLRRYPSRADLEAALAARLGVGVDQVLATCGGDDALDRACRALLGPGRVLLLPEPTFEMLHRYTAWAGGTWHSLPWPGGAWPLEGALAAIEALGDALTAIAVVSPNNPTGAVATTDDLRALSAAAPGAVLLVDQAYGEFADDDLGPTALSLPNALLFGTFSKAWGLAGARVGWVAGPAELIGWLRAAGNPYTVSGPSARLALRQLQTGEPALTAFVAQVRAERASLSAQLRRHGFAVVDSQANFVFARDPRAPWLRDALAGVGISIRAWPGHPTLGDAVRITAPGDAAEHARLALAIDAALAPEAVLFDMDGVLADTSRSYRAAIQATAAHFGVDVTQDQIHAAKALGGANNDWALTQRLLAAAGVEVDLAAVTEVFEALYQGAGATPGLKQTERLLLAPEAIAALAARRPLGVVTGRPRKDALEFLDRHGLREHFQVLVCMEDAPLKPDPAPTALCLAELGVRTGWLIGDTVDDVRSARGAGVVPLGVVAPGDTPERCEPTLLAAGAARVLRDTPALVDLVALADRPQERPA
jgi:HAD superfamily hydrolase (TIGR01548 family)